MSLSEIDETVSRQRQGSVLLTFRIEGELFGLPVSQIQEILDPIEPTDVPLAAPHAPALFNVRGVIVPSFDLRHCLRIRPLPEGAEYRIVVIDVVVAGAPTKLAIAADSVEAVVEIAPESVTPLPPLGSTWPDEFIAGVAHLGDDLVVLLDSETLFNPKTAGKAA
jgi:purine-binding chemotaxis protein CheW